MSTRYDTYDTKAMRKALKEELGYGAREVSVRNESYSMGHTLHFTVRAPHVDYAAVKKFVGRYEKIDRCKYSGEILSGGNTYVHLHVTDEVKAEWAAPLVDKIAEVAKKLDGDYGLHVPGLNLVVWRGDRGNSSWSDYFHLTTSDDLTSWHSFSCPRNEEGYKSAAADAYMNLGPRVFAEPKDEIEARAAAGA